MPKSVQSTPSSARTRWTVKPALVFEIGLEGIQRSARHKSGVAVRFPRMLRWRRDKGIEDAERIETLLALAPA